MNLDGQEKAYLIRLLKREAETLNNVASGLLKSKDTKIEDYEDTLDILETTNNLISKLDG